MCPLNYDGYPQTEKDVAEAKAKAKETALKLDMLPEQVTDAFVNRMLLTHRKYWGQCVFEELERLESIAEANRRLAASADRKY